MKNRGYILILSSLLLIAVSYGQVFHKILKDNRLLIEQTFDTTDDVEEGNENSSEENSREADQDEDPFSIHESMILSCNISLADPHSENYLFGLSGFDPEIVSPPPQL